MGIDQTLQQSERGSFQRASTIVIIIDIGRVRIVCLMSPSVPYGSIAEPVYAILFPGSTDKRIIYLRVRQSLRRLGSDQGINAFFQKIMSEIQRNKRRHFISQLIAHFLKMTLEIKILLFAICPQRIHTGSKTTDITTILFAVVHTQPTVTQLCFKKVQYAVRDNELGPVSTRTGTGNISPQVKQIEIPFLDLGNDLFQIILKNQRIGNPQDIP